MDFIRRRYGAAFEAAGEQALVALPTRERTLLRLRLSYMSFNGYGSHSVLCATRQMPNAKVPYQRFWLDRSLNAVDTLRNAGLMNFSSTDPCP